jgi:hypothetical protein
MGDPSLLQQEFWGLLAKCQLPGATGSAAVMGEQSLWAAGALGPAYTGALISLVFQGEGSRSCSMGECGVQSFCVCREAGLTRASTK